MSIAAEEHSSEMEKVRERLENVEQTTDNERERNTKALEEGVAAVKVGRVTKTIHLTASDSRARLPTYYIQNHAGDCVLRVCPSERV